MNRFFYIDTEGKQKGTFTPEELQQEGIKRDTLVWTQGMGQWKRADETDDLRYLFSDTYRESQPSTNQPPTVPNAQPQVQQTMPKTWLVESILVTILPFMFCGSFLSLLGIIGIIYAAQVESFFNRGDYTASLESSRSAAKWTKIAMWIFIAWVLLIIIGIVLCIVLIGSLPGISGVNDLLNT